MNKSIILVSLFGDYGLDNNDRISNVFNAFPDYNRFVITSDFNHATKCFKESSQSDFIKYIHVPNYKTNISFRRLYSHIVFAFKLTRFLNSCKIKPTFIYCAMPSSLAAYMCGKYCKKNDIKFVVDVIDLWPDSLLPISSLFKLLKPVIFPWRYITYQAYSMADYISAESEEYAKIALKKSKSMFYSYTYLGIDVNKTKILVSNSKFKCIEKAEDIWICYGGSLGNSYDFETLLDAIKYIHNKNIKYKFIFVGDGELKDYILKYSDANQLNVEITGRLPYNDYLKYLSICDIAINTFKESTKVVYSYKFNDYVASHLFVLNNLRGETSEMVNDYSIGLNFDKNNLSQILYEVCSKWEEYKVWKTNSIKLIEEKLETKIIYSRLSMDILRKLNLEDIKDC